MVFKKIKSGTSNLEFYKICVGTFEYVLNLMSKTLKRGDTYLPGQPYIMFNIEQPIGCYWDIDSGIPLKDSFLVGNKFRKKDNTLITAETDFTYINPIPGKKTNFYYTIMDKNISKVIVNIAGSGTIYLYTREKFTSKYSLEGSVNVNSDNFIDLEIPVSDKEVGNMSLYLKGNKADDFFLLKSLSLEVRND